MHRPSRHAERYSANASSQHHSPARPLPMCGRASCAFLQHSRADAGGRELTVILRPGLWKVAGSEAIQHLAEVLLGQIFVSVLPDQHHRRVHAGAKALDFFPAEIAVLGQMKGLVMNPALAHLDDLGGAAQPARRGAADLHMGLLADRLQLEHRVEGRDLERANVGHLQEISHRADRGFGNPAVMLFLDPPQDRYHRRRLATFRIFGDLRPRPSEVFRREREVRGLQFLWCEAADRHVFQSLLSVSHCARRAAFAFRAWIRLCQNALAVPNTLYPMLDETLIRSSIESSVTVSRRWLRGSYTISLSGVCSRM